MRFGAASGGCRRQCRDLHGFISYNSIYCIKPNYVIYSTIQLTILEHHGIRNQHTGGQTRSVRHSPALCVTLQRSAITTILLFIDKLVLLFIE